VSASAGALCPDSGSGPVPLAREQEATARKLLRPVPSAAAPAIGSAQRKVPPGTDRDSDARPGREVLAAARPRGLLSAMRMHYNGSMFKAVRDSDWSARHIAAHGVTLERSGRPSLNAPTGPFLGGTERHWPTARLTRAATSWWWQWMKMARHSSSRPAT
jgi:hypothetical protein